MLELDCDHLKIQYVLLKLMDLPVKKEKVLNFDEWELMDVNLNEQLWNWSLQRSVV